MSRPLYCPKYNALASLSSNPEQSTKGVADFKLVKNSRRCFSNLVILPKSFKFGLLIITLYLQTILLVLKCSQKTKLSANFASSNSKIFNVLYEVGTFHYYTGSFPRKDCRIRVLAGLAHLVEQQDPYLELIAVKAGQKKI